MTDRLEYDVEHVSLFEVVFAQLQVLLWHVEHAGLERGAVAEGLLHEHGDKFHLLNILNRHELVKLLRLRQIGQAWIFFKSWLQ